MGKLIGWPVSTATALIFKMVAALSSGVIFALNATGTRQPTIYQVLNCRIPSNFLSSISRIIPLLGAHGVGRALSSAAQPANSASARL
ncbi:hypothetical protein [Mesorhizobium mediterraneum]|uniref:hypothetical protein n=1 Tax=Mesorhizobium mediterraneum TaxID=43617 RepID=UPI001780BD3E|nr:hypothetical protein [Mesorhizobium mediterraneum]